MPTFFVVADDNQGRTGNGRVLPTYREVLHVVEASSDPAERVRQRESLAKGCEENMSPLHLGEYTAPSPVEAGRLAIAAFEDNSPGSAEMVRGASDLEPYSAFLEELRKLGIHAGMRHMGGGIMLPGIGFSDGHSILVSQEVDSYLWMLETPDEEPVQQGEERTPAEAAARVWTVVEDMRKSTGVTLAVCPTCDR